MDLRAKVSGKKYSPSFCSAHALARKRCSGWLFFCELPKLLFFFNSKAGMGTDLIMAIVKAASQHFI